MRFDASVLTIDPAKAALEIEAFIRDKVANYFKRRGVVVGLSGGIDSALSAALSVRALGADRVFGVYLPERDSSSKSLAYGQLVAKSLGIESVKIDITPQLESFGVYERRDAIVKKLFPALKGPYTFRIVLPQDLLERDRLNIYHLEVAPAKGERLSARLSYEDYLNMIAANDIKQRTRMTWLYYEAERRGYVVGGTTNRSELEQGFFVKYGDGGVDIEPLAHLYKNQVYQIARCVKVPQEVIDRTPSPDTYSLEVSDKEFYFCLPYETADLILYAITHNVPKKDVAAGLGLESDQLERAWRDLQRKKDATEHLRSGPPNLPLP